MSSLMYLQDVVAVKEAYEGVWTGLNEAEQEEIINENIIRPDAILTYEGHVAIRDTSKHPSAATSSVRLSSFGVDKVYPRLQVISGQKLNTFEDTTGSQGEDLGSDCVSFINVSDYKDFVLYDFTNYLDWTFLLI